MGTEIASRIMAPVMHSRLVSIGSPHEQLRFPLDECHPLKPAPPQMQRNSAAKESSADYCDFITHPVTPSKPFTRRVQSSNSVQALLSSNGILYLSCHVSTTRDVSFTALVSIPS